MKPSPIFGTTTIVIDRRIGRLLKTRCAELSLTMRETVETLVNQWLEGTKSLTPRGTETEVEPKV